jgi:leukotriene-A4 hydrolase
MATTSIQRPRDPNTLSNYTAWASRHVTANLEIVFDQKKLVGNVVHQLESKTDGQTQEIIFDTSFLDISQIKVNGQPSKWEILPRFEPFGSALKIQLESAAKLGENLEVDVRR